MKYYVAGPMRGYPQFNFPAFHEAAAMLRARGHEVFSPAERDIERHNGVDVSANNPDGCEHKAAADHGFSLRDALHDDMVFIAKHADALYMLKGWEKSSGAIAEHALAKALDLKFEYA